MDCGRNFLWPQKRDGRRELLGPPTNSNQNIWRSFSLLQTEGNKPVKLQTTTLAIALAMTSSVAFAQMGGGNASGAEVPERSGTAVDGNGAAVGTEDRGRIVEEPRTTTGMAPKAPSGTRREPGGP